MINRALEKSVAAPGLKGPRPGLGTAPGGMRQAIMAAVVLAALALTAAAPGVANHELMRAAYDGELTRSSSSWRPAPRWMPGSKTAPPP